MNIDVILFAICCIILVIVIITAYSQMFLWAFYENETLHKFIRKQQSDGKLCQGEVLSASKAYFEDYNIVRDYANNYFVKTFYKIIDCKKKEPDRLFIKIEYSIFHSTKLTIITKKMP